MKAIAILWNSMEHNFASALNDINRKAQVLECFKIDFKEEFKQFIADIYPYEGENYWKLEYKIKAMFNRYSKNEIYILFLEVPDSKKIYIERKSIFIYENVEELKKYIRNKYKEIVSNYAFDNVFHMTDDMPEFEKTLLIIYKHFILNFLNRKNGFIKLDDYLLKSKDFLEPNEKNGKRKKFYFADSLFMFKASKSGTYETYSELFFDEIANQLGLKTASSLPAIYHNQPGLITHNFLNKNEFLIEGTELINFYLAKFLGQSTISIEEICKHNNLEEIPLILKYYCEINNISFKPDVITELKKMFVCDIILLQSDRTPNNWGIVVDAITATMHLAPLYDNTNIMCFNKPLNNLDLNKIYQLPTMLLATAKDSFFDYKLDLIKRIQDEELKQIFKECLNKIEALELEEILKRIEETYNIELPKIFKEAIHYYWNNHIENLNSIIKPKQKVLI